MIVLSNKMACFMSSKVLSYIIVAVLITALSGRPGVALIFWLGGSWLHRGGGCCVLSMMTSLLCVRSSCQGRHCSLQECPPNPEMSQRSLLPRQREDLNRLVSQIPAWHSNPNMTLPLPEKHAPFVLLKHCMFAVWPLEAFLCSSFITVFLLLAPFLCLFSLACHCSVCVEMEHGSQGADL